MSIVSWGMGRAAGLPAAETRDVMVERDLEVKMADGEVLLADRWFAPTSVASAPIVLLRSPYGRRQMGFFGRVFAERGYQTVIQSCRGTFGSGGAFEPFHHEQADGTATLEWLTSQSWFTGSVGTFGPSYLGFTQWAVAGDAPDYVKAMALHVTASCFRDSVVYPGGSFSLETGATWVDFVEFQECRPWQRIRALATAPKRTAPVVGAADLFPPARPGAAGCAGGRVVRRVPPRAGTRLWAAPRRRAAGSAHHRSVDPRQCQGRRRRDS